MLEFDSRDWSSSQYNCRGLFFLGCGMVQFLSKESFPIFKRVLSCIVIHFIFVSLRFDKVSQSYCRWSIVYLVLYENVIRSMASIIPTLPSSEGIVPCHQTPDTIASETWWVAAKCVPVHHRVRPHLDPPNPLNTQHMRDLCSAEKENGRSRCHEPI